MRAVEVGDLDALVPYLTPAALDRVGRDLDAWRAMLLHPREGPRLLASLPPPRDPGRADEIRRALSGDAARLFRLYAAADPHPFVEPAATAVPPGTERVEVLYPARDGSRRSVILSLEGGRWRVDRLQL
jgi:hypothetical protein